MTTISTANTAREMVRSATSTALRVAARGQDRLSTARQSGATGQGQAVSEKISIFTPAARRRSSVGST